MSELISGWALMGIFDPGQIAVIDVIFAELLNGDFGRVGFCCKTVLLVAESEATLLPGMKGVVLGEALRDRAPVTLVGDPALDREPATLVVSAFVGVARLVVAGLVELSAALTRLLPLLDAALTELFAEV